MIAWRSSPFIGFPSRVSSPQDLLLPFPLLLLPLDLDSSLHILETIFTLSKGNRNNVALEKLISIDKLIIPMSLIAVKQMSCRFSGSV